MRHTLVPRLFSSCIVLKQCPASCLIVCTYVMLWCVLLCKH